MMVMSNQELDRYLEARIDYCVARLMQSRCFPEDAHDDLCAELRLVVLQAQRAYDPRVSSPKTYYSRKIEFHASNLFHRQCTERAHLLFLDAGEMPQQVASLEGVSLGLFTSASSYPQITSAVDERLAGDVAASWLAPDLRRIFSLLRQGVDRMTICRALGITASTLSRKISRLHTQLRSYGIDLPATAFPRAMRRRMLSTTVR
ncbi:MAG: hypothetical protein ACYC7E_04635 [Armatimonadota bacterium]